jgi:chromosome segregation ATPase
VDSYEGEAVTEELNMEESGFGEGLNKSITSLNTDDGSMVRVVAEAVELPLETDGTLLFSTLQAQFAGAAGLYYTTGGNQRRAVKYNASTGLLLPPPDGWADRNYSVSYFNVGAPGKAPCLGVQAFDKYDEATKSFQESCALVQQMLGAGQLPFNPAAMMPTDELKHVEEPIMVQKVSAANQGAPSPPHVQDNEELTSLKRTVDTQQAELADVNQKLAFAKLENEQIAQTVQNLKEQLEEQRKENEQLRQEKDELNGKLEEVERQKEAANNEKCELEKQLEEARSKGASEDEKNAEIADLKTKLENETKGKEHFEKEYNDINQQLNDTKWRCGELEAQLGEKDWLIGEEKTKTEQRENELRDKNQEVDECNKRIGELEGALEHERQQLAREREEKEALERSGVQGASEDERGEVADLKLKLEEETKRREHLEEEFNGIKQQCNDSRWRCGELEAQMGEKDWLIGEERGKAEQLQNELTEKSQQLDDSNKRIGELESALEHEQQELAKERAEKEAPINVEKVEHVTAADSPGEDERNAEIVELKNKLEEEAKQRENLQKEYSDIKQERDDSKWRCGELEAQLGEKDWLIGEERGKAEQLQNELTEKSKQLDDSNKRIGELEGALEHERQELARERAEKETPISVEKVEHVTAAEGPSEDERSAEIVELKNKLEEEAKQRENLQKEYSDIKQERDETKWRCGELEAQLGEKEWLIGEERGKAEQWQNELAEKNQQLDDSNKRIGELEGALEHEQQELAREKAERETLICVEKVEQQLSSPEGPSEDERNAEIVELKNKLEDESKQRENLEKEYNDIKQQCNDAKWRCGELEAQLGEKEWLIGEEKGKAEQWQNELAEKNQQLDDSNKRIGELECALDHERQERAESETPISVEKVEHVTAAQGPSEDERNAEIAELKAKLEDEAKQRENLQKEYNNIKQEYDSTKWRCGELEAQMGEKDWLIGESKGKEEELRNEIREKHQQLEDSNRRIGELEGALEHEREELTKERAEKETQPDNLEQELSSLQDANNDLVKRVEELEKALGECRENFEQDLKVKDTEIQRLKDLETTETNGVPDNIREKMNTLSQKKAELKAEVLNLKEKCCEMKKQKNAEIGELKATLDNETKQREHFENEYNTISQQFNDTKWRCGELEAQLGEKEWIIGETKGKAEQWENELREKIQQLNDSNGRIGELEHELENERQQLSRERAENTPLRAESVEQVESAGFGEGVRRNSSFGNTDVLELTTELKSIHQRKFEMEGKLSQMQEDLNGVTQQKDAYIAEVKRLESELWIANERKAQLEEVCGGWDSDKEGMQGRISWLEGELHNTHQHKDHLQHRVGELQGYRDRVSAQLWDSFLVRKEPYVDRHKWNLAMWNEHGNLNYVRVWFELDWALAKSVYLIGSFFNWEFGLLCTMHDHGKWGVWVDIPRGRHEFRFLVDGKWQVNWQFPTCPNPFGSDNNWRHVE